MTQPENVPSSLLEAEPASGSSTVPLLAARSGASARHVKVIRPPSFSLVAIFAGLRNLAQYSDLLYTLSVFRLSVRYKQSALGWMWAAIQPLALMGIYTFVFAHVAKVNTGGVGYPIFVFSALLPWIFFSSSIGNAVHGLVMYPNLLTKMYFPREIIPLSYLAAGFLDFLIASVILLFLMAYYRTPLTWKALYAIPIILVLGCFAAAVALVFSAIHIRFRDVGLALPFILQVWMFAAPVVYSVQSVPERFRRIYLLDPVAGLIENFRRAFILGEKPDTASLALSASITVVALAGAYVYFKGSEGTMADLI